VERDRPPAAADVFRCAACTRPECQTAGGCANMQWRNAPGGYLREVLTAKVYDVAVETPLDKAEKLRWVLAGSRVAAGWAVWCASVRVAGGGCGVCAMAGAHAAAECCCHALEPVLLHAVPARMCLLLACLPACTLCQHSALHCHPAAAARPAGTLSFSSVRTCSQSSPSSCGGPTTRWRS
jgi:hypothetical protein